MEQMTANGPTIMEKGEENHVGGQDFNARTSSNLKNKEKLKETILQLSSIGMQQTSPNTGIGQDPRHEMVYEKVMLDPAKLSLGKEGDAGTMDGVRVKDKGRLETKEKPTRLQSQSRSRMGRELYN